VLTLSEFSQIDVFIHSDGNIRYYEYESDNLFALSEHKSSEPQRGLCFLPRRGLNVAECEIARAYKVSGNYIEPIAFVVPRRVCHILAPSSATPI
jgi:coronin-1B/1C/6